MKKLVSLVLVIVLCASLSACGKSVEELSKKAIVIDLESFYEEFYENKAAAEAKYKNLPLRFDVTVSSIDSYHFTFFRDTKYKTGYEVVRMDKKSLATLKTGHTYTIIAYYDGSFFYDAVVLKEKEAKIRTYPTE